MGKEILASKNSNPINLNVLHLLLKTQLQSLMRSLRTKEGKFYSSSSKNHAANRKNKTKANSTISAFCLALQHLSTHHAVEGDVASCSSVVNGIGFLGAGKRPILSTLSLNFGGGLAAFGSNLPFFSNHSGFSRARNPNLL